MKDVMIVRVSGKKGMPCIKIRGLMVFMGLQHFSDQDTRFHTVRVSQIFRFRGEYQSSEVHAKLLLEVINGLKCYSKRFRATGTFSKIIKPHGAL
ncbi:hypothetical protein CI610_02065 [invertebrate metagenome]|uniref:Uncharacterized protein n=1 Tax=invertebrate metagenome TaxID=1711999 RepID=A0A2H9T700_9ZZZZ